MAATESHKEPYRPQFHFTPEKNWMNDPNGLVYHRDKYHLFYQYNPGGNDWGNMSWGHAVSTDLAHWTRLPDPVGLQAVGYESQNLTEAFFSGGAVSDLHNTSGSGVDGNGPLVAIFTINYPQDLTLANGQYVRTRTQAQGIAYSNDDGLTWTQYEGNPVIPEPPSKYADQYENFRDPSVFWYEADKTWVMVVALSLLHKMLIYTSPDLKTWTHVSEFGPINAVGGKWECPNLFPLPVDDDPQNLKWIMVISLDPGGPCIGSGTQYVVGSFDGKTFTADPDCIHAASTMPADSVSLENCDEAVYADGGFPATDGSTKKGPVEDTMGCQQAVVSFTNKGLPNTVFDKGFGPGGLMLKSFTISKSYINILIGGGTLPYETVINLLVGGAIVRTVTAQTAEILPWHSWEVASLVGKNAIIQIVDPTAGRVTINRISFSDSAIAGQKANWVDYGPDFYAPISWTGVPNYGRVAIAWMSNWAYAKDIPTSPWRGAMSVPRVFGLKTINGKLKLVQSTVVGFQDLMHPEAIYANTWQNLPEGSVPLPVSGKTLDVAMSFRARESTGRFGVTLRAGGGQETVVGYDFATAHMYVDRRKSGSVSVAASFPGVYYAPLAAGRDGKVTIRTLLDWSSVEVFGGEGEATITAQIFPDEMGTGVSMFCTGEARQVDVMVRPVDSAW